MPEKFRLLWEQLSGLWVCIALNPTASSTERQKCRQLLLNWSQLTFCPLEDANFRPQSDSLKRKLSVDARSSDEEGEPDNEPDDEPTDEDPEDNDPEAQLEPEVLLQAQRRRIKRRARKSKRKVYRTIFNRALEASQLQWDDSHLCAILDGKYERTCDCRSHSCCSTTPATNCSFESMRSNRSNDQGERDSPKITEGTCSSAFPSSSSSSLLFSSQGYPLWIGSYFSLIKFNPNRTHLTLTFN
jgi:hypothetical protein